MKKYEVFLFDADNTLYDYDKAEEYAFTDNAIAVLIKNGSASTHFLCKLRRPGYWCDGGHDD